MPSNLILQQYLSTIEFDKSLYENHPDAICVMDLEGNLVDANPAFRNLTGYSIRELLQLSIFDLFVHENLLEAFQSIQDAIYEEKSLIDKNRNRIEVEITRVPITFNNNVAGVYAIVRNITKRKRQEEELRATK